MGSTRMGVLFVASLTGLVLASFAMGAEAHIPSEEVVKLAVNGSTQWRIGLSQSAGPVERFAAAELRRYFEQITGTRLENAGGDTGEHVVTLGLRGILQTSGGLPSAKPGYDGYAIVVSKRSIVIAGDNPRGLLYGVYDLLEQLGCRWFYPTQDPDDPEVVPHRLTLAVDVGARAVASSFKLRICNGSSWFFKMDTVAAFKQLDWAMKARYNAMGWQCESDTPLVSQYERMRQAGLIHELDRRGMLLHGPGHAFNLLLSHGDYKQKHPEWFGMREGKRVPQAFAGAQFCWSNPDARRQMAENTAAFVSQCPRIDILYIAPFDGGKACECSECGKIGAGNALMLVMRDVIERLSKVAPHVLVETVGGYSPVQEPPGDVEVHPEQRVIWADWGRHHGFGYDDQRYGRKTNLETWRKAARAGITICQYYTDNFAEPWILPPFATAIEGDRRYMIESGIDSVYMLMWPPGYWWNHGLNGYLAGRCFYNASRNPFEEIRDYALHYFGPRAGPMLADYFDQWARNVGLAYRIRGGSEDSHRAMLAVQRQRWIDPAVEAVKDDPILAHRVGKVALLHALAERLTESHRRRDEIRRLRQSGKFDRAQQHLDEVRTFTDKLLACFYQLADLNQGLMDRNEVPSFIQANVQGWLDEEARAITNARWEARMKDVEPAFTNPIYEGADPWVTAKDGYYYLCRSEGNRGISVWKSDKLTDRGTKRIVWRSPDTSWNARQVWAPELHDLNGRWVIYYAASDGHNANHRTGVLEAKTDDPQGAYLDKGMLYTGDDIVKGTDNRWSIDATPLQIDDRLYLVWSGWPGDEDKQFLYIAPMANPWTVAGDRIRLCDNATHTWERVSERGDQRGLHEAPQVLLHGDRIFIVYSCSGSWEPTYKLGLLSMDRGANPLDPKNWTKAARPVFAGNEDVLGVGHASFAKSPDGSEDWLVYHSKVSPEPGWRRAVSLQPFTWTTEGFPHFGAAIPFGKTLPAPAGEAAHRPGREFRDEFDRDNWDNWVYYGYNRFIWVEDGVMNLGGSPAWGRINDYRTGEKALVRGQEWADFSARVRVRIEEGSRDAGILFRVRRPAVGYDAQRGYFAGIIPRTHKVVLGKTNGTEWQELAIADHPIEIQQWVLLRVDVIGDRIKVLVGDEVKIDTQDRTYARGRIGVRVVDTHAIFDDFHVFEVPVTK